MLKAEAIRRVKPWPLCILYIVALLTLVYWDYPFEGMVINEGWGLHFNDVREFKFFGYGNPRDASGGRPFLYNPSTHEFDFSFLYSRRGLVPIVYLLLDLTAVGDRIAFTNAVCVAVVGVNLVLFSYVAWKLGGQDKLFPMLVVYSLYPFSAGAHYWQALVGNNTLAVTFFLLSLALFVTMDYDSGRMANNLLFFGIPSLICFWLSVFTQEYGLFLAPLYLYLALYYSHRRTTLWRFTQWRSPYVMLGYAFLLMGGISVLLLVRDVPSVLMYESRFRELATVLHMPQWLLPAIVTLLNALLFYLSATFSNTIGLLLYPAVWVWDSLPVLRPTPFFLLAVGVLAVGTVAGVVLSARRSWPEGARGNGSDENLRFLITVGVAWTILAYLPFSTHIGYPRVVGLMADRVNILAACGVAIVLGTMMQEFACRLRASSEGAGRVLLVFPTILAVVAFLFVLNLYVQREYYVEAYRKEREISQVVLTTGDRMRRLGYTPVVLLDRSTKVTFPRAEILAALREPRLTDKAQGVLGFLFDRHFRRETVSTSFHLHGLDLFGCCPDSAYQTFNGYAKLWSLGEVPVYKKEEPFRLYADDGAWRLGYEDTRAWAPVYGAERLTTYSKRDHQLLVLELEESFFELGGAAVYHLRPYSDRAAGVEGVPLLVEKAKRLP